MGLSSHVILICKERLVETKMRLMGQLMDLKFSVSNREFTGDEGDLSMSLSAETHLYIENQRLREQLLEVEFALGRIEMGSYGICEETNEPIGAARLLALPWTRLSIEGAELRESSQTRHTS